MVAIGIDLGGTRIKGILMAIETDAIVKQLYHPTHGDKDWKQAISETVAELRQHAEMLKPVDYQGEWLKVIGLSAPGLPDDTNQAIASMPGRLSGLEGLHWGDFLNARVYVVNDAHAALLAETRFGVAKGGRHVLLLTLGTGVGGGLLIDGKLYQGNSQKAGHLGHITVDSEGDRDITGIPGSLEDAIGDTTVEKRSLGRYMSTYQLLEAYRQGDPFAQWVWLSSVRKLAVGICSLINCFSPDMVVLSGGITQAEADLLQPLSSFMDAYEWRPGGAATPIRIAHFGDLAGAIGAAGFASQEVM